MTSTQEILPWPVDAIDPHPRNRRVNVNTVKFAELRASIRSRGVQQALIVRSLPDLADRVQCLSGHRRLAAAELEDLVTVPVIHKGRISDAEASEIMTIGNLQEDLSPLEEGERAALLLETHGEDVAAVASLLGKTETWVVQHAQIYRGLSPEWQKEILEAVDHNDRPKFARWTAGHLAVIAKLPAVWQASYLGKVQKDYRWSSCGNWTIGRLEDQVKLDLLYLSKAPFDEGTCCDCVDRSDRTLGLWGPVEDVTGDKTRCLNKKCWDAKCRAHQKQQYKAAYETAAGEYFGQQGDTMPPAVPLSLLEEPSGARYTKHEEYRKKISALKKAFPKLVTAGEVTLVEADDKGAVPAIVVAGGKGKQAWSCKWVKVKQEKKKDAGRARIDAACKPSAAELKRRKESVRWEEVWERLRGRLKEMECPSASVLLYLGLWCNPPGVYGKALETFTQEAVAAWEQGPAAFDQQIRSWYWGKLFENHLYFNGAIEFTLRVICPMLGVDIQAIYNEVVAAEQPPEPPVKEVKKPRRGRKAKKIEADPADEDDGK